MNNFILSFYVQNAFRVQIILIEKVSVKCIFTYYHDIFEIRLKMCNAIVDLNFFLKLLKFKKENQSQEMLKYVRINQILLTEILIFGFAIGK